jgi:hypothetical protein
MQEMLFNFFRPVALGTGAVLALIVLVGLRLPRRANVATRTLPRD